MTTIHTINLPSHYGEKRFAEKISAISDPKLNIWFALDYLPGVSDIDVLLLHESIGAFILEVKAVPLSAVEVFAPRNCQIEGRKRAEGPNVQAYKAFESLRTYLRRRMKSPPFFTAVACWPKIKRNDWQARFPGPDGLADQMLFQDDFESGTAALLRKLEYICINPPIRGGVQPRVIERHTVERLKAALTPELKAVATFTEKARLRVIETSISAKTRDMHPAGGKSRVIFDGLPGTGKTFRLLQIGMNHCREGSTVLFLCFNKVLASDIRRLLRMSTLVSALPYNIEVYDVFQIVNLYFSLNSLSTPHDVDPDSWGKLVIDEFKRLPDAARLPTYDTILVDEAQDMKGWHLDFLDLLSTDATSVFLARGRGQEIYNHDEEVNSWLKSRSSPSYITEKLRRNFRNPPRHFVVAQSFFNAYPGRFEEIRKTATELLSNLSSKNNGDDIALFERKVGDWPRLVAITCEPKTISALFDDQEDRFAQEFQKIIKDELIAIEEDEHQDPIDLLILVPNTEGVICRAARRALTTLATERGTQFIDYTNTENRRTSAANGEVRLCNYHSSRGLEAERVVIFGFEGLKFLCEKKNTPAPNLGFIVLSRAVFDTVVVLNTSVSNQTTMLLEEIFSTCRSLQTG